METTVQKMTSAFFFIIFSILIVTSWRVDADPTGAVDNFVQNSSAAAKQDAPALSGTESKDPGPEGPALVHPRGVCYNTSAIVE